MSEDPLAVELDDVHLRWMREAMGMVRTHPIVSSVSDPRIVPGRRGNDGEGSPSWLCIRSRR